MDRYLLVSYRILLAPMSEVIRPPKVVIGRQSERSAVTYYVVALGIVATSRVNGFYYRVKSTLAVG